MLTVTSNLISPPPVITMELRNYSVSRVGKFSVMRTKVCNATKACRKNSPWIFWRLVECFQAKGGLIWFVSNSKTCFRITILSGILIVKNKKPRTTGVILIKPCTMEIVWAGVWQTASERNWKHTTVKLHDSLLILRHIFICSSTNDGRTENAAFPIQHKVKLNHWYGSV